MTSIQEFYTALGAQLAPGAQITLISEYRADGPHKTLYSGPVAPRWQEAAAQAYRQGAPLLLTADGTQTLIEPLVATPRLIILGGGHIALPLTQMAALAGFAVTVCDDRPSFANRARFPQATAVLCNSFERCLHDLQPGPYDYIVVVTRGHRHDSLCLQVLMEQGSQPHYLGMIGSKRRVAAVKQLLTEEVADSGLLARLQAPIGLDIGAETPEEIAVSILAQLIQCRRHSAAGGVALSQEDQQIFPHLAQAGQAAGVLITVVATSGSTPRNAGAKLLLTAEGGIIGSIGGGCAEAEALTAARGLLGTGGNKLQTVDLSGSAYDDGMVCGGTMQVLLEDLSPQASYTIAATQTAAYGKEA